MHFTQELIDNLIFEAVCRRSIAFSLDSNLKHHCNDVFEKFGIIPN